MFSRYSKIFKGFLVLGFFGLIIYLIYLNLDDFKHLATQLDLKTLLVLMALQIPLIGFAGLPFKMLSLPLGYRLVWRDWLGLSYIANFINQVLPYRPGMAFRYLYLKKKYQFTLSHFTLVMILYMLLLMGCSALMIVLPWLLTDRLQELSTPLPTVLWITVALLGLGVVAFLMMKWIKKHKVHWLGDQSVLHQMNQLRSKPGILLMTLIGFCAMQLCLVLSFKLVFFTLGHSLNWFDAVFICGILTWSLIVPITPGNVGLIEAFIGGLTQTLYGQFSLGFSAVFLWRITQLVVGLVMSSGFSWLLFGSLLFTKKQFPIT